MQDLEFVRKFFERDCFAKSVGIKLLSLEKGKALASMTLAPDHLNGLRTAQGGAIFTLADFAFAAACNSHGQVAVAIQAGISFMKAVSSGALTAEAIEESLTPRLGSYTIRVRDESGDLVAIFEGLAYRKKQTLQEIIDARP